MGSYIGGSAPAMARQVCDGFTLLSQATLKRLDIQQMKTLEFEIDKRLRETRSEPMDLQDQPGLTRRNRRLSRIEGAIRVLRYSLQLRQRGRL